jgi:hypothetical protein
MERRVRMIRITPPRAMPAMLAGDRMFWGSTRWSWFSGFGSGGGFVGLGVKKGPPRDDADLKSVVASGDDEDEMAVFVGVAAITALDVIVVVVVDTTVELVLVEVLVGFAACCDGLASAGAGLFPVLPN